MFFCEIDLSLDCNFRICKFQTEKAPNIFNLSQHGQERETIVYWGTFQMLCSIFQSWTYSDTQSIPGSSNHILDSIIFYLVSSDNTWYIRVYSMNGIGLCNFLKHITPVDELMKEQETHVNKTIQFYARFQHIPYFMIKLLKWEERS